MQVRFNSITKMNIMYKKDRSTLSYQTICRTVYGAVRQNLPNNRHSAVLLVEENTKFRKSIPPPKKKEKEKKTISKNSTDIR